MLGIGLLIAALPAGLEVPGRGLLSKLRLGLRRMGVRVQMLEQAWWVGPGHSDCWCVPGFPGKEWKGFRKGHAADLWPSSP